MNRFVSIIVGVLFSTSAALSAKPYKGAELYSLEEIKYGRFETRMQTALGGGILSVFFLYYNNSWLGGAEPWREIDIEVFGKNKNSFQSNIITGTLTNKTTSEQTHASATALCESYHTYAIEWTPDYIAWFLDGKQVRKTTGQQATDCRDKMQSYRYNLWISSSPAWAGEFKPSVLPVYQFVNWLKYYDYTPGQGPGGSDFSLKWTDNFDSFSSARWAKAKWTFDGNEVDFDPENIILRDGTLILCLTDETHTGFSGTVPQDNVTPVNPQLQGGSPAIQPMPSSGVVPVFAFMRHTFPAIANEAPSAVYTINGRAVRRIHRDVPGIYLIKTGIARK